LTIELGDNIRDKRRAIAMIKRRRKFEQDRHRLIRDRNRTPSHAASSLG
jgi:hypothetical protein